MKANIEAETKNIDNYYAKLDIKEINKIVFNLPKEEYYVLAYDKKDEVYDDIYKEYISEDDSRYVYVVDLSLGFNKHVLSDESNTKPKDETEIKIKEVALMKFKDGKLVKYLETEKDIRDELK